MAHTITLIPGDGIGPEVTEAVVRILAASGVSIDWERHDAGVLAVERGSVPLPVELLDSIRRNKVALKGPVTTPIGTGFTSVNVGLRKALDLFANLRPVWNMPGIPSRFQGIDMVIVRENTEDLYAGPRARGGAGCRRKPEDHHGESLDAHREVRLRVRPEARPQEGDLDSQGQHHEVERWPVHRERPRPSRATTPRLPTTRRSSTPPACTW